MRAWRRTQQPVATGNSNFDRMLDELEDAGSQQSKVWDEEHDRHVVRRLLALIAPEFEPTTWQAFQLLVLQEKDTAEVASLCGLSVNAVRNRQITRAEPAAAGNRRVGGLRPFWPVGQA